MAGLLETLHVKGPCTVSEVGYRTAKEIHRKLMSMFKPVAAGVFEGLVEPYVVVSDNPKMVGLPPGLRAEGNLAELEVEIGKLHQKIIHADKVKNVRAAGAHEKLIQLMRKVKVILWCQRQQVGLDRSFGAVQDAFSELLDLNNLPGTVDSGWLDEIDRIKKDHLVATEEATNLANDSPGAVLLIPSKNGWDGAVKAAKDSGLLKPDFPDLSVEPLSSLGAIEIRKVAVQKREGLRQVSTVQGRLRLVTVPEFMKMARNADDEPTDLVPGKLQFLPVQAGGEGEVIPAAWVKFPDGLDSSSALLIAQMLEVDESRMAIFSGTVDELVWRWRLFGTRLVQHLLLRKKYRGRPLNLHVNYEDVMTFTGAFIKCLSANLIYQIQGDRKVHTELKANLEMLVEAVDLPEYEFISRIPVIEEEDEEDEDDASDYGEEVDRNVVGLESDALAPPNNPLVEKSPTIMRKLTNSSEHRPRQRATLQTGGRDANERFQRPTTHPLRRRSRSRSYDSLEEEVQGGARGPRVREEDGGGGRPSPPATTVSQMRGEDPTHTIALQLQRCRQVLLTMVANPDSTKYKNQRAKVGTMLALAEKHLREDINVSVAYGDFLLEEMTQAEADMAMKDDELDVAEKKKKRIESDKKDLLATLPRGLGQKFSGSAADWPAFRHYFVEINESVSPPLAVAHMTALIECPKLKKRMKIYRSGDEVLKDFDKDYGHSFLNCQLIIEAINNLKRATNREEEMDMILKYRHAKRSLDMNADHEKLLNVPQMVHWADQLLPTTTEDLMRIIQDDDFGEEGSAVEKYFAHLEKVYERNSVLLRNRVARHTPAKGGGGGNGGKKVDVETDLRSYDSQEAEGGGCTHLCSTGPAHRTFNCPLLKEGKISLKKVRSSKLCTCCLTTKDSCRKGKIQRKDGSVVSLVCDQCKHNKRISCHQNCNKKGNPRPNKQPGGSGPVDGPPVEIQNSASAAASLTELRTEMTVLANPCSLGSAMEMADRCILVAPDGTRRMVRCIYDSGGTDSIVSFELGKYFHNSVPVAVSVNGANTSKMFSSHVGELQVLKADGTYFTLKAIKGDLSGRAFELKDKFVDVPPPLHPHFSGTMQTYNDVGDLRVKNVTEDFQVQLIIGLDACAMSPMEMARYHDESGQLVLWRSLISNQVIVTGSRKTGLAATIRTSSNQRSYVITEEGNNPVTLMRTTVGTQDSRELFTRRSDLSRIEKKFFSHIEDNDQIVPPQPELCASCKGCTVCSDPFKSRREKTVIKLLDQLVTFKEGPREEGGGYHVRLLYDPDRLLRVPVGREAALRRLLATERQLMRPEMQEARKYFNAKVEKCRERGYLVTPDQFADLSHLQKAYQPFSFALKDEEYVVGVDSDVPLYKTKARPVVDCSAVAVPGMLSLNAAQFKIPDLHTSKISEILLRLRSAKRFCIADVTEFYFRLFCDQLTTSMTRVLFREGGLGGGGEIIELLSPVTSMGITQVPTFAAHVRYLISLTIAAVDSLAAEQLRDSYCDDVTLFEKFGECGQDDGHLGECDDGEKLVQRAKLVEDALRKAHLHFGENWITDMDQSKCPPTMTGVQNDAQVKGGLKKSLKKSLGITGKLKRSLGITADSEDGGGVANKEVTLSLGNAKHTSALGYRLHLGPNQPSGGSLLWRVHRPQTLNLEPKLRGARPVWSQLSNSTEIRQYLREKGVTKASLLSLCSSMFDPLLLTGVFISTARQLFRKVLREVKLDSWKSLVPEQYHDKIACLAEELLTVSKGLKIPRLAVVPNPIQSEAHKHPHGYTTLLFLSDGSGEAGAANCYIHQMFPYDAGLRGPEADFSDVTVTCNLLCSTVKLTDNNGNNSQVCGELLGKLLAVQLKEFVMKNILIKVHEIRVGSDSLTVEKALRKSDACFSTWAGRRIAAIQRGLDLDDSYHVPHTITDATVDPATKFQRFPSKFLNRQWFHGEGVLDKPLQLLPWTDRSSYMFPKIEDLPSFWLSTAARTFLGLKLPAVIVMKMQVDPDAPVGRGDPQSLSIPSPDAPVVKSLSILEALARKHSVLDKAVTVLQNLLKMGSTFRALPATEQREYCLRKFLSQDYGRISRQLGRKSTKLSQELILQDDVENKLFYLKGRYNYIAKLLANPRSSAISRLVLRDAHGRHHLTSSARILAKIGRTYLFTGGADAYLKRLRAQCTMCKLLKPEPVKMLMGNVPEQMRGPLPEEKAAWRFQSCDIFGPWAARAYLKARGTRASSKKLKMFVLLVFDFASRAVDAEICEDYSTDSVLVALRAIWSRTGKPRYLSFDAAANLSSAGALLNGEEGMVEPSIADGEALQRQLRRQIGHQVEMRPKVPYASHRQGAVERSVAFCKKQIIQALHDTAGGLLTPLQASSVLASCISFINERPLLLHSSPSTLGHLTPWYLSPRSISVFHSQIVDDEELVESRLSKRAIEGQRRLQRFKRDFNVFYYKRLVKLGKWNTTSQLPQVGSVCLILDKKEGKRHFLQKFCLGRVSKFLSEHVVELEYVRQDSEVTAQLIQSLRDNSTSWRDKYKVTTLTCTRDIKGLSLLADPPSKEEEGQGVNIDVLMGADHTNSTAAKAAGAGSAPMDAADADVSGDQEGPGDQKEPEDVRRQNVVSDEGEVTDGMRNLQRVDAVPVQKKKKIKVTVIKRSPKISDL